MNFWRLRIFDFVRGVIYAVYLTPTYVNILPIYAIANIHDITWGSRPEAKKEVEHFVKKQKELIYKNYRSKFLIIWIIINILVGYAMNILFESDYAWIILYVGSCLICILAFKILLSIFYRCKERFHKMIINNYLKKRKSKVFSETNKERYIQEYNDHTMRIDKVSS